MLEATARIRGKNAYQFGSWARGVTGNKRDPRHTALRASITKRGFFFPRGVLAFGLSPTSMSNTELNSKHHVVHDGTGRLINPGKRSSAARHAPPLLPTDPAAIASVAKTRKRKVAFFSLEMSGPEGSKAFCQGAHREICRDPPNADGDPQYQVTNATL